MTREEAIKIIKDVKEKGFKHTFYTVNEYHAALDMAIEALRREDTLLDKVLEIIDNDEGGYGACLRIGREVEALKEGEQE